MQDAFPTYTGLKVLEACGENDKRSPKCRRPNPEGIGFPHAISMRKLIIFAVLASLFCGCNESRADYVAIVDYSRPNEQPKRIQIPKPLVYDRHEYNINPTGGVVMIYFTPGSTSNDAPTVHNP